MMVNRCLAHVINLATQALIATYSKSPYFDPKNPDAHVPTNHDEVGLVHQENYMFSFGALCIL